jgi:hypothetical protein
MEFWKEVRQQVLTGPMSQRAACKKYSLGWHTLKKILAHAEAEGDSLPSWDPRLSVAVLSELAEDLVAALTGRD